MQKRTRVYTYRIGRNEIACKSEESGVFLRKERNKARQDKCATAEGGTRRNCESYL